MSPPTMLCRRTVTLLPNVAKPIVIPIQGATNWGFNVKNAADGNPITVGTIEYCYGFAQYSAPQPWNPDSIPIAAGGISQVQGTNQPVSSVRVTFTSPLGTVVTIDGSGQ